MSNFADQIKKLVEAAVTEDAGDALKFSQAALNVAHAQQVLAVIKQNGGKTKD